MKKKTFLTIFIIFLVLAYFLIPFKKIYTSVILDNEDYAFKCSEFTYSVSEVEKIMEKHDDVVKQIIAVDPGFVEIWLDIKTCPGKSGISIIYASHDDRIAIKKILKNQNTFFGIPYEMRNF